MRRLRKERTGVHAPVQITTMKISNSIADITARCLFSCQSGKTLYHSLDAYAAQHGSAVGVWHVITQENHWVFESEADARALVARLIVGSRWLSRNETGSALRSVRRLCPPRHIRDSGRSYRGKSAGQQWDCDSHTGWIRLYQRTEQMEHGRAAERIK